MYSATVKNTTRVAWPSTGPVTTRSRSGERFPHKPTMSHMLSLRPLGPGNSRTWDSMDSTTTRSVRSILIRISSVRFRERCHQRCSTASGPTLPTTTIITSAEEIMIRCRLLSLEDTNVSTTRRETLPIPARGMKAMTHHIKPHLMSRTSTKTTHSMSMRSTTSITSPSGRRTSS